MKVIDNTYKTTEELQTQIQAFAKEFASKGQHRIALKDMKTNIHHDTHMKLLHGGVTYLEMLGAKPFDMAVLKGKL